MAFFTRTKQIPVLPDEEGELSDEWEELEERRTPDGRSSKTSYERREQNQENQVIECKNPCIPEPCYENENDDVKTEEVRYDFVVDRVLGVQV